MTIGEPLDELYLTYLYKVFASVRVKNPKRTYWQLTRILYTTEFVYVVSDDENRMYDGRELRNRFVEDSGYLYVDDNWMDEPVSVLEVILALAFRLEFETDIPAGDWFWKLLENLNLTSYNDSMLVPYKHIKNVLENFIWRKYTFNGIGGLFPLNAPKKDQRKLSLWDQLSAYLLEPND